MMIKTLLDEKKITLEDYQAYSLFRLNEVGVAWLNTQKEQLFNAIPDDVNALGSLAFLEGARNVYKEIIFSLNRIEKLLEG